jgi:hypothetical protein
MQTYVHHQNLVLVFLLCNPFEILQPLQLRSASKTGVRNTPADSAARLDETGFSKSPPVITGFSPGVSNLLTCRLTFRLSLCLGYLNGRWRWGEGVFLITNVKKKCILFLSFYKKRSTHLSYLTLFANLTSVL